MYYYLSIKIMKNLYLINGRFSINIYKMAIKCIIIILLLFTYLPYQVELARHKTYYLSIKIMENMNNFCHNIRINSLFFK